MFMNNTYSFFNFLLFNTIMGDFYDWFKKTLVGTPETKSILSSISEEFCYGLPIGIIIIVIFLFFIWRLIK